MLNFLRLFCRTAVLLLLALLPFGAFAQVFIGEPKQVDPPEVLKNVLSDFKVYRLNVLNIKQFIEEAQDASTSIELQLGAHHWNLQLEPSRILSPDYSIRVSTDDGIFKQKRTDHRAFKGVETSGGGKVRLTLDKDFIHGFVEAEGDRFYLEPLWYHVPDAERDLFMFYAVSAVNHDQNATCIELAGDESIDHLQNTTKFNSDAPEFMACYEMEIAIASDKSMHTKYGSVSAVENHNIAVINDVNGDYSGSFNHDIDIVIVTQFVVTGTDPWTNSNDAGTLLSSFRTWGNANGFGVPFDNGELWTNRDFTGSTVGIAYLNGVCNTNKYHCLQDFSSNAEILRCMTSHEIGHNFTATHDATGCPPNYIMCPFVSTSSTWSTNSVNQISAYITTKINSGCFEVCGGNPPLTADFDWSPKPPCEDEPVQFTDMSTGNITSRSWSFPGGAPATSTATNPIVTWFNPGSYNVTLTVNGAGGPVSTTKTIVIEPKPTANFTFIYTDLTYTFTSTSTNAVTYNWDFGDGFGYSSAQNPVYTYPEPGIYMVSLMVENNCGTATKTTLIVTVPVAAFSASPTSGCATMTVQYTNESSSNSSSYLWNFPGGIPSTSNSTNPIVVYSTSGMYSATLTAYNGAGSSSVTYTNLITVQNIPSASFTKTIDSLTVTFTNTSVGATSFLWNFGDGNTSTMTSPVHTYATGGVYTVSLTSTNACGSTTATQTLNLIVPPAASFTATPTSGCGPLSVQFTSTSTGNPTSYAWTFPGGTPSSSTIPNPLVVYNTPGSYNVTLTVSNTIGSNSITQTNFITVNTAPNAGFTTAVNLDTVAFTNTSTGATSYNWSFGDGGNSTAANPVHVYAADGTYTVTLISTNPCGADTESQTVTIVTVPTAGFTAAPTSGCGPLTVQFTNTSSSNSTNFNWSFPGGVPSTSTAQNPSVTYNTPGTYSVTLTVSNAAGSNSTTQTNLVTVNPGPTAGFTSATNGFSATFTNTSSNSTSYSWDFGDGNNSSQQNPTHIYDEDGPYIVVLTATNACGTNTFTQTVVILTAPTAGFTASPTNGCGPLTVQFANASSNNATNFNWSFPGGTPTSSTMENPSVTYSTPGSYSVTLTVSNAAGSNTATQTNYITVNSGPTAGFSSTVSGATATFTNTSGNSTSYSWNFGDGNNSTQQNPVHTYSQDGTYSVVLTATNPCGTSTFTQTVTITTAPTAGFTAGPTSGCGPLTVQFTNTSSSNATNFNWSFPGGTPSSSTVENPSVTYNTPGTYSVTLTVSNSAGTNSTTQTNVVTVNAGPTAGFTATVNGPTATFTNTSNNSTSYSWDFGDGNSSTNPNPMHSYTSDGTYTVVLTATNPCGTSTFTQTVTVVLPPTAGFTPSSTEGCAPLEVQFVNNSSANATSFAWTFEGGNPATSTESEPMVTFDLPGVYTVTLVATNSAGSNTSTSTITVLGPPTSGFTAQTAGLSVVLTNTSVNATSYNWEFGDGNTSTATNPTHTYSSTGMFTIVLRASNACGTTVYTQEIEILGTAPIPAFTANEQKVCIPMTVQFTDQSAGDPTAWNWTFPGGSPATSNQQNPAITYSTPGIYAVTLEVTNAFGSNSMSFPNYIEVLALPEANFNFAANQTTVTFNNLSQNGDAYQWNFGDGNGSTLMNPVHTYPMPGTYTVELTVVNNCGASTLQQMIVLVSGTGEAAWLDLFRLYPNPNTGLFTLEMNGEAHSELEFTLVNSIGQLVNRQTADFSSGQLKRQFDYSQQPTGMYTLTVRSGSKSVQVKLVIQR